jgi:mannose-1-phosphate guanylyltransferase
VHSNQHLWAVILAAGEGKRVKDLTRDRRGLPAPKQYSLIDGGSTLLDATIERARRMTPPERIVAVVARQHRRWWATELAGLPTQNLIVQPENRGTAAGVLLPLLWVTGKDPEARLVFLPSDHGVASEETLHQAITEAVESTPRSNSEMVLLGMRPEGPETGYGWIVPDPCGESRFRRIACFREKPDRAAAAALFKKGALLNSFIVIAGARFLLDLYETSLPELWRSFQPVFDETRRGSWVWEDLTSVYDSVPTLDFSRDLLEKSADSLWVHSVPACGWLDLGTPERLANHLNAQGQQPSDGLEQPITSCQTPSRIPHAPSQPLETAGTAIGIAPHAGG